MRHSYRIFSSATKWNNIILTQKRSHSKLTGNNKTKLPKIGELLSPKWLSFQTLCVQVVFGLGIPRNSRRLGRTFWLSAYVGLLIDSRFICCLWYFCFCFIMKGQQKLRIKFTFYAVKENGCWNKKAWRWAGAGW